MNKENQSFLKRTINRAYWTNFTISMLAIAHDLTFQELIREQEAKGAIHLGKVASFLNNNFVGDVGNAFAAVFGVPVVAETVNLAIQKSNANETLKKVSDVLTMVAPFAMAALFIAGAIDAEGAQHIIRSGTPDGGDLFGAIYGTLVALPSAIKFRNKVFPRNKTPIIKS